MNTVETAKVVKQKLKANSINLEPSRGLVDLILQKNVRKN